MAVTEKECSTANSSSSTSKTAATGGHYLAKSVLHGSAVLQVAYGHIRSPSSYDVVFGKETSLELVNVGVDGVLKSVCEQPVFGVIKDLALIPWNDKFRARTPRKMQGKDLLAVLSDSGKLSFLVFCNEMHRFLPLTRIQLPSPGNSRHELGRMLVVDSGGCFIATSAYVDQLALISLSRSGCSDITDKGDVSFLTGGIQRHSICGTIWSTCFISRASSSPSNEHNPVLAIIVRRIGASKNELLLLEWNILEDSVIKDPVSVEAGPLAHAIVEVPGSNGFAFLFRFGDVLLMDLRDRDNPYCVRRTSLNYLTHATEEHNVVEDSYRAHDIDDNVAAHDDDGSVKENFSRVCSWSWEPGSDVNPRMIFVLDSGDIHMVGISFSPNDVKVNYTEYLYKDLSCQEILWTENGFVAAIVEMGDGVILKLEDAKLIYGSPIQNIAPILDMSLVDYHDEKQNQMFACCGLAPEGSLRIIRNGASVEKLLRTEPVYQGVTGTWTLRKKEDDWYHSFLVLSFIEETRVLSVGMNFTDVTDSFGFRSDVCTLACGLVVDGLLCQVHQTSVQLCMPTNVDPIEGIPSSSPACTSWSPDNASIISLGAVKNDLVIISSPCCLYILGIRSHPSCRFELFEMKRLRLLNELSCIFVPQTDFERGLSSSIHLKDNSSASLPVGVEIGNLFVIGTHRPSVEVLSFDPKNGTSVLASGIISLTDASGTFISECIPQDVTLVLVDRLYVLSGLRNGMLLRFEWPSASSMSSLECCSDALSMRANTTSDMTAMSSEPPHHSIDLNLENIGGPPIKLQLIATRRIGISPVFLVPLSDHLDSNIIVLSDRPWLLQTARPSLSYTSISFQSCNHLTPVSFSECPNGIMFVADNSLHLLVKFSPLSRKPWSLSVVSLSFGCDFMSPFSSVRPVEMVCERRLNAQKFLLEGAPRKVLYHNESKLLLVLRTDLSDATCSSDVCYVDPRSGSVISCFKFQLEETGKSMELLTVGNEVVLVVGTSFPFGSDIRGRLLVFCLEHVQNTDIGSMTFSSKGGSSPKWTPPFCEMARTAEQLSGSSACSSTDDSGYGGAKLEENKTWQLRLASATLLPGMVLAICPYLERYFLASADNDFYVCGLSNDTSKRVTNFAVGSTCFLITTLTANSTRIAIGGYQDGILFYSYNEVSRELKRLYGDPSKRIVADCTLVDVNTAVISDRKGNIAILSCSDSSEALGAYYVGEIAMSIRKGSFWHKLPADGLVIANNEDSNNTITACTMSGSILLFIPLSRKEHELLEAVQARLVAHPLTAPVLGNGHNEFRSRENQADVPLVLDGDMLAQFLELTTAQKKAVLSASSVRLHASETSSELSSRLNQVVQLLERFHHALG